MRQLVWLVALTTIFVPVFASAYTAPALCFGPGLCVQSPAPGEQTLCAYDSSFCGGVNACSQTAVPGGAGYPFRWCDQDNGLFCNVLPDGTTRPPLITDSTYELYVLFWDNTGALTWTLPQKQLMVEFLTHIAVSPQYAMLAGEFGKPFQGAATSWPSPELVNCLSGTPAHCLENSTGIFPNPFPTSGPVDPRAMQIVVAINGGGSTPCSNGANNIVAFPGGIISSEFGSLSMNGGLGALPNGLPIDGIIGGCLWQEFANGMAGWSGCAGIHEVSFGSYSNIQVDANGFNYNFTFVDSSVTYEFLLPGLMQPSQGGNIGSNKAPFYYSTPCHANGDCPAFSGKCGGGFGPNGQGWGAHCQPPSITDGIKNGFESGIDCGTSIGPNEPSGYLCANGQTCNADADCHSGRCVSNVCSASPGLTNVQVRFSSSFGGGTSDSIAFSSNVTSNNLLVVMTAIASTNPAITSITDLVGTSFSKAQSTTSGSGFLRSELWYGTAGGSGSDTVTINWASVIGSDELFIQELSGGANTLEASASGEDSTGATQPLTGTFTTTTPTQLMEWGFFPSGNCSTPGPGYGGVCFASSSLLASPLYAGIARTYQASAAITSLGSGQWFLFGAAWH